MATKRFGLLGWLLLLLVVFAAGVMGTSFYYEGKIEVRGCISQCDIDTAGDPSIGPSHCDNICGGGVFN